MTMKSERMIAGPPPGGFEVENCSIDLRSESLLDILHTQYVLLSRSQ